MAVAVFLSVGRTVTDEQERFVLAVERCLQERGLHPHTLGRNDWSSLQPLRAISELMERCSGTAVIAFERVHIAQATDLAGAPVEGAGLPTVWNQIEAAMAYTMGHPLLVLAEDGLRSEGLLESRYDWMVQWVPLEPGSLEVNPCRGVIDDWKQRVLAYESRRAHRATADDEPVDLSKKSVGEVLGMLRPGQLYALVGVCVTVVVGAFTLGATLGGG